MAGASRRFIPRCSQFGWTDLIKRFVDLWRSARCVDCGVIIANKEVLMRIECRRVRKQKLWLLVVRWHWQPACGGTFEVGNCFEGLKAGFSKQSSGELRRNWCFLKRRRNKENCFLELVGKATQIVIAATYENHSNFLNLVTSKQILARILLLGSHSKLLGRVCTRQYISSAYRSSKYLQLI